MELKLTIDYQHILELIRQLPIQEVTKLLADAKSILEEQKKKTDVKTYFQQFLSSAPTMTDEQYQAFLENRQKFSQWRAE
jgi:hypothetical protein